MGEKFNEPGGPIGPPEDGSSGEPHEPPPQPPPEPELPQPLPEPPEDLPPGTVRRGDVGPLPPSAPPPPIDITAEPVDADGSLRIPAERIPAEPVDAGEPFDTGATIKVEDPGDAGEPVGTGTTFDRPGTRPEHGLAPPGWSHGRDTGSQGRDRQDWLQSPDGKRAIWDFIKNRWVDAATMEPMPPEWGSGYRPGE